MKRIVLVDDDARQLRLATLRFRQSGYEVASFTSARDALAGIGAFNPDLVVSDVLMDDLDGFGLCRRIRQESRFANVPVLLLSAHYDEDVDRRLAERVGAAALVRRTPELEDELAAVKGLLSAEPRSAPNVVDSAVMEEHLQSNAHQISRLLDRARDAQTRYLAVSEQVSDAITILTTEGLILEASKRWHEILGVDPEAMRGRHIADFGIPAGPGTQAVEICSANGATVHMEFSTSFIGVEGKTRVVSVGRDVTDRVLANARLALAEERYRTLVERLPDVIWTLTETGQVTFITPNVEQMLGFSPDELYRQDAEARAKRVHPDDRALLAAALTHYATGGEPFDIEYRCQHKDGRWLWLRSRATACYLRNGVRLIEGVVTDLTERYQLEDSLRQAQKMEAVGLLTGGIAHDFNNILSVIIANAEFLIEAIEEGDPRRSDAVEIKRCGDRAASLTKQLLAFSRRQILEPKSVDLRETVTHLEKMLRRLIGEDITLEVSCPCEATTVRVDTAQFEQVLINLAVNARDAMTNGGRLSIELATTVHNRKELVTVSVRDDGCGMDAKTRARIFEPFFTTKQPGRGTGLGLSMCYGIVQQSGGDLVVTSEVGAGTCVEIRFPRVTDPPPESNPVTDSRSHRGCETILVVEDDESVRSAVHRMLASRGYHLLLANTVADAVRIARAHGGTIDLVLSDVVMPGGHGPQVVREVRAVSSGAKALFMSGYAEHRTFVDHVIADANFLPKPFTADALPRKVREVLDA